MEEFIRCFNGSHSQKPSNFSLQMYQKPLAYFADGLPCMCVSYKYSKFLYLPERSKLQYNFGRSEHRAVCKRSGCIFLTASSLQSRS